MLATQSPLQLMAGKLSSRVPLDDEEVKAILDLPHRVEEIEAGRYLVREGEKPSRCFVVVEGFAYRHKIVTGGARQIVSFHLRGDLIDLQNSLLEISDENVQAMTKVKAASIPVEPFNALIDRFPAIGKAALKESLVTAAIFSEWVANVGRRDSRSRMAHILCELSLRQRVAGLALEGQFDLPMTQDQLADAVGLTSVHVNRTLKRLEEDGLISRNRRSVTIADWNALARAGDFNPNYLHLPDDVELIEIRSKNHIF